MSINLSEQQILWLVWEPICLFALVMILAKVLGALLVAKTSGFVNEMLSQEVDSALSRKAWVRSLLDRDILADLVTRLIFFYHDLNKLLVMLGAVVLKQADYQMAEKVLIPQAYWSGTPPNRVCTVG